MAKKRSNTLTFDVGDAGEDGALLALAGVIDVYTAPAALRKLVALLERGKTRLIVNLENVHYIDSTGLGTLLDAMRRARARGGALSVITHNEHMLALFEVVGLRRPRILDRLRA